MRELVYIYRTEKVDYAKELIDQELTPVIIRLLASRYKNMIAFLQLQPTDLHTTALKALDIALEQYDYAKGPASFKSFYGIIAIRQMQSLLQKLCTAGEMRFAKMSSLDSEILSSEQHKALSFSPGSLQTYQTHDLDFVIKAGLSEHERHILDLKLSGYKNQEIALMLSSRAKTVANTYEKTKRRLRVYLEQNGMLAKE